MVWKWASRVLSPALCVCAFAIPANVRGVNVEFVGGDYFMGTFWDSNIWLDSDTGQYVVPGVDSDVAFQGWSVYLWTSQWPGVNVPASTTMNSFTCGPGSGHLTLTSVPESGTTLGGLDVTNDFWVQLSTVTLSSANVAVGGLTSVTSGASQNGLLQVLGVGPAGALSLDTANLTVLSGGGGSAKLLVGDGALVNVSGSFQAGWGSCAVSGGASLTASDAWFWLSDLNVSSVGAFNAQSLTLQGGMCEVSGGGALTAGDCKLQGAAFSVSSGGSVAADSLELGGYDVSTDVNAMVDNGTLSVLDTLGMPWSGILTVNADYNALNTVSMTVTGSNALVSTNQLQIEAQQGKTASVTFDNGATLDIQNDPMSGQGNILLEGDASSPASLTFDHGSMVIGHQWGMPSVPYLGIWGVGTVGFKGMSRK